jgi:molybdopterin-containing oxidoreductase family membrane subunit
MMAFNAWMYFLFMGVAAVAWLLSYRRDSVWLKPVLILGILLSTMFPSQSGAFFGVVQARPFWHNALLPVLFFTSAMTAGAALLLVVRYLVNLSSPLAGNDDALRLLRRVTLVGLLLYFFFEFAEFSIALWNPLADAPAIDLVLYGPYWWVFWIVHLMLGGLVAVGLLAARRNRAAWFAGAALVAVTFVSVRLNVLVPGQAVGEIENLQMAFQHERLTYLYDATLMEYLVGLFLVAVGMAVFYAGKLLSDRLEQVFGRKAG